MPGPNGRPALQGRSFGSEHGQSELLHPLFVLGAEQFAQAGLRARVGAGQSGQRGTVGHQPQRLGLGQQPAQLRLEAGSQSGAAALARRSRTPPLPKVAPDDIDTRSLARVIRASPQPPLT